jgi:8-oxo-dGTP pyrophosphatase MutT (NUDIX family)
MPFADDFLVRHEKPRSVTVVIPSDIVDICAAVNRAFQRVIDRCIDQGKFHVLSGRHSEYFALLGANYPIRIERFATSLFGVTSCGVHLVSYVHTDDGLRVWIARRAAHLYISGGKLDTTVAGGVKAGVSPLQTIVEEAQEEASLPEDLVRERVRARDVMTIMNCTGDDFPGEKGLVCPDVVYLYDMELPTGVVPKPQDEEVQSFTLMTVDAVQKAILADEFKPDSAAVLVAFFIRQSIITPENEKDFVDIVQHLHRRLPFPIKPDGSRNTSEAATPR